MNNRNSSYQATPRLVRLDPENFDKWPCCGIKKAAHCGRRDKLRWLREQAEAGLIGKLLVAPNGEAAGYVEYVPGESAWRGIAAANYLVIHCVWVFARKYQGRGWGRLMVEDCLHEAKLKGKAGVAAVVRNGAWSADRRLFTGLKFEAADTAPPDFQLMAKTFDAGAPKPAFKGDWENKAKQYPKGLTIIRSGQCPHITKFADDIAAEAQALGLEPRVVTLTSARQAQEAPTPYAVFCIMYNGRVVADHQISRTRFKTIVKTLDRT
jgi:Acetyltransferase (GNAT) family.